MDDRKGYLQRDWWPFLLRGIAAIIFGMSDHREDLRIVMAIRLRREINGERFLVAGDVLLVLFGVPLFNVPGVTIRSRAGWRQAEP